MNHARLEPVYGKEGRHVWGLKDEEYMADFCLIAKRTLNEFEHAIFRFHYLLGADWKLCCRRMKMERGEFFHEIYRVEEKLGRIFREVAPYALYPLDEYFGGTIRKDPDAPRSRVVSMIPVGSKRRSLRPPLRKVA